MMTITSQPPRIFARVTFNSCPDNLDSTGLKVSMEELLRRSAFTSQQIDGSYDRDHDTIVTLRQLTFKDSPGT